MFPLGSVDLITLPLRSYSVVPEEVIGVVLRGETCVSLLHVACVIVGISCDVLGIALRINKLYLDKLACSVVLILGDEELLGVGILLACGIDSLCYVAVLVVLYFRYGISDISVLICCEGGIGLCKTAEEAVLILYGIAESVGLSCK